MIPIYEILNKKFPSGQYAIMEEVSDEAGFNRSRSADFIIMGLWPSRGLHLTGIERKSHRGDWLGELKNPKKAENIFQYCDYFYLLTDNENVAKIEEIPERWGWMHIDKGKIITKKEAPKLTPVTVTSNFLAALLKRASAKDGYVRNESIKDQLTNSFESGKKSNQSELDRTIKSLHELQQAVKEFKESSGIDLKDYQRWSVNPKKMGEAVKIIASGEIANIEKRLMNIHPTIEMLLKDVEHKMKILKEANPDLLNA